MWRVFQQIVFVLLAGIVGFVAGGLAGAATVPAGSGLAGGASVFVWGVGGLLISAVAAAFLAARLNATRFRLAFVAVVALASIGVLWLSAQITSQ